MRVVDNLTLWTVKGLTGALEKVNAATASITDFWSDGRGKHQHWPNTCGIYVIAYMEWIFGENILDLSHCFITLKN